MSTLSFQAVLKYHVRASGVTTFTEEKIVVNTSDTPVDLSSYADMLPKGIQLNTLNCHRVIGQTQEPIGYELTSVPGTNRMQYSLPAKGQPAIRVNKGETKIVTQFMMHPFYDFKDHGQFYFFSLHHSLPDLPYLRGHRVAKRIEIVIEKPRWLFHVWDLYSVQTPTNNFHVHLRNMDPLIRLEYYFDLALGEHYFNSVALRQRPRFNYLPLLMKFLARRVVGSAGETAA